MTRSFVEKWCYGFVDLTKRVREYPPEKMAEVTWVPAEKIREAARMFATNKPASARYMVWVTSIIVIQPARFCSICPFSDNG